MLEYICFWSAVLYVAWMMYCMRGLRDPTIVQSEETSNPSGITLLFPLRNEENNILSLLKCLQALNPTPFEKEIIFINDHCTDRTIQHILNFSPEFEYKLIHLNESSGKKSAISAGVQAAKHSNILCTDADCYFSTARLETFSYLFDTKKAQFIAGPVQYTKMQNNFFAIFLQLELAALTATSRATLEQKWPTMCNGANMGFTKEAFEKTMGFADNQHIASGDDQYLMRSIFKQYPDQVVYASSSGAEVYTAAPNDFKTFYHQRIRWASKWGKNNAIETELLAVFIWIQGLITCGAMYASIFHLSPYAILFLMVRMYLNHLFLKRASISLFKEISLHSYLLAELVYPWYVVYFGLASRFQKYRWKDRIIN